MPKHTSALYSAVGKTIITTEPQLGRARNDVFDFAEAPLYPDGQLWLYIHDVLNDGAVHGRGAYLIEKWTGGLRFAAHLPFDDYPTMEHVPFWDSEFVSYTQEKMVGWDGHVYVAVKDVKDPNEIGRDPVVADDLWAKLTSTEHDVLSCNWSGGFKYDDTANPATGHNVDPDIPSRNGCLVVNVTGNNYQNDPFNFADQLSDPADIAMIVDHNSKFNQDLSANPPRTELPNDENLVSFHEWQSAAPMGIPGDSDNGNLTFLYGNSLVDHNDRLYLETREVQDDGSVKRTITGEYMFTGLRDGRTIGGQTNPDVTAYLTGLGLAHNGFLVVNGWYFLYAPDDVPPNPETMGFPSY